MGATETYSSRDHSSLESIVSAFLAAHKLNVDYACLGIAGPVRRGEAQLTNLPWTLNARALTHSLGLKQVWLINDLAANAHGIAGLAPSDFIELNHGDE